MKKTHLILESGSEENNKWRTFAHVERNIGLHAKGIVLTITTKYGVTRSPNEARTVFTQYFPTEQEFTDFVGFLYRSLDTNENCE